MGRGRRRNHGGQGDPLRDLVVHALRRVDHRHLHRRGQLDARELQPARRRRRPAQHDARRGVAGRHRFGPLRRAGRRHHRGVHRGTHGRPHAGAPRQDHRPAGDHPQRALHADHPGAGAGPGRAGHRAAREPGRPARRRATRPHRDGVRVHLRREQQRQRVRRPHRRPALPQPHPGPRDGARAVRADAPGAAPSPAGWSCSDGGPPPRGPCRRTPRCSSPSWSAWRSSSPASPTSRSWLSVPSRRHCHEPPGPHCGAPAGPRQARPPARVPVPRHLRRLGRLAADHRARRRAPHGLRRRRGGLALGDRGLRQHGRGRRRGPGQGPGRDPARRTDRDHGPPAHRHRPERHHRGGGRRRPPADRRPRRRRGRTGHPGRRRRRRRAGDRGRVGHHRRVGPGDPGVRRRPVRRHRWHDRAVRPHRRQDHDEARRDVHRPDDRARRGRLASEDAQRDRPQHPPGHPHHHLPARRHGAAADGRLLRRAPAGRRPRRPARLPHPDHHRGAALGHRHRRHGPPGPAQRAGDVRPGGRGRG